MLERVRLPEAYGYGYCFRCKRLPLSGRTTLVQRDGRWICKDCAQRADKRHVRSGLTGRRLVATV